MYRDYIPRKDKMPPRDDELSIHRNTHTKENSWWQNDAKGIPLCRVCDDCIDIIERIYPPEVLGISGNYDDVVDERIEDDY